MADGRLSGAARSALKERVAALGVSVAHFNAGKTRLVAPDALEDAVLRHDTWEQIAATLGFSTRHSVDRLIALAAEHGIDTSGVRKSTVAVPDPTNGSLVNLSRDLSRHDVVALMLTAAWFASRGAQVHIAAEGCKYDLVVDLDGRLLRVQVKSTMSSTGTVHVGCNDSAGGNNRKRPYRLDEVDQFALFTPDAAFLVPARHVCGKMAVGVRRLHPFRVDLRSLHPAIAVDAGLCDS